MGVRSWEANLYSREQEWRERAEKAEAEVERLRAAIREWADRLKRAREHATRNVIAESVAEVEWDMRETADPRWTDTEGER